MLNILDAIFNGSPSQRKHLITQENRVLNFSGIAKTSIQLIQRVAYEPS